MKEELRILPFFPLKVFLLPGEDMPLRIFEPRYLQLIDEARRDGITFVIPYVQNDERQEYGCEVKLQQVVAEGKQGQMVITVESLGIVKILSYTATLNGKLYSGGEVTSVPYSGTIQSEKLINLLITYTEQYDQSFLEPYVGKVIDHADIIRALNLSSEDKYRFFHTVCHEEREKFLQRQLQYLMLIREQEQLLDDDFHLN